MIQSTLGCLLVCLGTELDSIRLKISLVPYNRPRLSVMPALTGQKSCLGQLRMLHTNLRRLSVSNMVVAHTLYPITPSPTPGPQTELICNARILRSPKPRHYSVSSSIPASIYLKNINCMPTFVIQTQWTCFLQSSRTRYITVHQTRTWTVQSSSFP